MMPLYVKIGKRIQVEREQAGRTQDELAEHVGLSRTSITNIERGRQKIQIHTLYEIARELGVGLEALLPPLEPAPSLEERLPEDLTALEREWVKHVLSGKVSR